MNTPDKPAPANEEQIRQRLKQMNDDQIVDFIRDTVARLDALADRLEVLANEREGEG